jgi:hypothetical protein
MREFLPDSLRSQLRYTVSYFLSIPNAYLIDIFLVISYVIRGRAKKTGLKIAFFSPVFCSFFSQKSLYVVVYALFLSPLPQYVIIITASTCLE